MDSNVRVPRPGYHARKLLAGRDPVRPERGLIQFALAKSLIESSNTGKSSIPLEELAEPFSRRVMEHLAVAPKQATSALSRFLEACKTAANGTITREALVGQTVKLGFQNVIDAFHVVNRDEIPLRFFEDTRKSGGGIVLMDQLFRENVAVYNHRLEAGWYQST
jgi:hypothetical protein